MNYRFKITRSQLSEYYRAPNGDHVAITVFPNRSVLAVCAPVNNELRFHAEYKNRRAALIAMTRRCGRCEFVCMTETYVKDSTPDTANN